VATHGQGLYQLNGQLWIEFGDLMEIEDEIIYNVFKDGSVLWINTLTKGVFQFNTSDSSFVNFREVNGLSNNHTRVTQKDSWGNIWIGTGGGGVSKYSGQTFEKWSKTNGLRGNYIYATYQDLNGSIWVGTSGGGVTIIDSNIRYLNSSNGFSSFKTKAIFQSRDSAIWLGTDGDGLSIILNDTILHFSTQNDLNSNWVKAFAEDAKGNVWVGTSGGGISKFTFKSDSTGYVILNYLRAQGDLISDRITDLVVDKNNRLWYATQAKGLGYISGKDFSTNTIPGLNGQNLRSLCVDSNHLFIAGTRGVNLISLNTDSLYVQNLEGNTELTSENIYSMQLDANGGLWVGTEKGLDHLVLDGNQVLELTHYDASNGFSGVETTTNGSMLDQEGDVWFGSIDGLFKFNSDGASKNMTPPKICWKEIKIGSETKEQIQEKHPRKEQWTLPYGNNRISFDFVGINQSAPKKVRYKWQLKGRDNHYSEPSQNHFVEYGSLPPGKYVFIASAENENGIWSKEPITFSFTVLTPIWMKTWFIAAVVATIWTLPCRQCSKWSCGLEILELTPK
jgi:ligand-binding sensor domain-containing protein